MKTYRHDLLFLFVLLASFLPTIFGKEAATEADIVINEICIVPEKETYPKWVELKSNSKEKINLNGYSLWDREKCIFKFDEDYFILPKGYVLICFYQGKEISEEFQKSLPENVFPINVFNTEAFDGIKEIDLSYINDFSKRTNADRLKHMIKTIPEPIFSRLNEQAKQIIERGKLSDSYRGCIKSPQNSVFVGVHGFSVLNLNSKITH